MKRLLTWRLWQQLRHRPDESPIYQRAVGQPGPAMPWYTGCAEIIGFVLVAPMLVLMGPVYGLAWSVGISGNIAGAKSSGRYDLLAVTPGGPLIVSWMLAKATLDRNGTFANVDARNTWAGRMMILCLVYAAFILLPRTQAGDSPVDPLVWLAALVGFVLVDHFQAIILAVLVGIIAPTTASERATIQWNAAAAYAVIQVGSYVVTVALIELIDQVAHGLNLTDLAASALALTCGLLFFAWLREGLIRRLWRLLLDRLNEDAAALDRIGASRL